MIPRGPIAATSLTKNVKSAPAYYCLFKRTESTVGSVSWQDYAVVLHMPPAVLNGQRKVLLKTCTLNYMQNGAGREPQRWYA